MNYFLIFVIFICQTNFGEFQVTFPENTASTTTTKATTTTNLTTTAASSTKPSSTANYTTTKITTVNSTTNLTTSTKPSSSNAITTTSKTNLSSSTTSSSVTTRRVSSSGTKAVPTTISKTSVKASLNKTTNTSEPNGSTTEEEPSTEEEKTTEESTTEEESSTELKSSTESENEESPSSAKTTIIPTEPTPVTGSTRMTRSECITCRNATSTNSTSPSSITGTPGPTQQPGMSSSTTNPNPTESTNRPRPTSKPHANRTAICVTTGYCEIAGGHSSTDGSGSIDVRSAPADNKTMTTKRHVGIENKGSDPITSGTSSKITFPALTGVGQVNAKQRQCDKRLELCCTPRGYQCGLRYPPVVGAPEITRPRTNYGAYPWQGIVFKGDGYWASGALIDNVNFITVAHRFFNQISNLTNFKVRLGEWDLRSDKEPFPCQEYQIRSITIHPKYNSETQVNDIAIITFTQNVTLGQVPTIGTGCLPAKSISGIRCWLSGWAMNTKNGTKYGPQVEVDLPIIDGPACEKLLRKTLLGPKFVLDQKSFLCAGGEPGKDASDGDNGSPLVCEVNRQFYITGLVAWGIDYGKKGVPGVYVNVNNYIPWIKSRTHPACKNITEKP